MRRRTFLGRALAGVAIAVAPLHAHAQSSVEDVVADLISDGFEVLEVRRTLLGRLRFRAQRDDVMREIVLNPSSGVILRDYSMQAPTPQDSVDTRGERGGGPPRGAGPAPGDRPPPSGPPGDGPPDPPGDPGPDPR